jgi:hypothetical protein
MGKSINITDKLSAERPTIQIGEKVYPIDNSMNVVFKFQELASGGAQKAVEAIGLALGDEASKEIDVMSMSMNNFKVIMTAILAAMQDLTYEEAEARFRRAE